jgi:DNA polymerase III subunit delta'
MRALAVRGRSFRCRAALRWLRDAHRGSRERPAGHAYLFYGPAGAGKRTIARAFAAALLADGAPHPGTVAERIARGTHPDLTWVTPSGAAEMLVSDIEEPVVAAATRTPFESIRRVFVIEAAQTMNDQAANRMLKTLEEPASFVHLILLADRREDVLATIASRCQHVRFDPLSSARIEERLREQWQGEQAGGGGVAQAGGGAQADGAGLDGVGGGGTGAAAGDLRLAACARLGLGDARLAGRLAGEQGGALRESAVGFVRAALAGRTGERPWTVLLEAAKAAGVGAGEEVDARVARDLEFLGSKERKRHEREGLDARRRAERRARTEALDRGLGLAELWLRDVWCIAQEAPEMIYAVDRRAELDADAAGRDGQALAQGIELVRDTRMRLGQNVAEELALEALAYRVEGLLGVRER